MDQRVAEIDRRIADLLALRDTLIGIRDLGSTLPVDKNCDEQCVCYLITTNQEHGQITIQREENV